ncbi:hypothetical protein K0M31_019890 [Melipona bicolor]|uniref:Uncharacterized protein n=1 Tax=Melipona bicolor TaxID=60889 RepID=A0AA40G0E8_9HYME|nr:hypothetical protein K0M31_019890 [Melipona bicolor]
MILLLVTLHSPFKYSSRRNATKLLTKHSTKRSRNDDAKQRRLTLNKRPHQNRNTD